MGCLTTLIVGVVVSCSWVLTFLPTASALGCFVCSSVNGSEPDCEDTFNNTNRFYTAECFAGRKGRIGVFPGTECIKLKARKDDGNGAYNIIVRRCVVDGGGINSETEVGRSNHCGLVNVIRYDNEYTSGCILSCDRDGCNSAGGLHRERRLDLLGIMGLSLWYWTIQHGI